MRILFRTAAIWLLVWATFSQKSVIAGGGENLASVSVVINKNRSYTPDSTLKLVIGPGQFPVDFEKENKVSVAVSVPVKGTYGQLVNSFSTVTFFLMPGDDLTISLSNTYMTEGVYFYGKGADRARLCNTKDLAFKNYQINPDLDKMEPAVYMGYLRRMADANRKFIFSHDFDEYFLKCEAERMSIRLYGDYPRYPINHRNATQGKEIVMNEAYWKFIYDSLIVENESLAYLKEYNDMLKLALGMIAWKLDDNLEEVREQISLITSRFKHPYTLEQLVHFFVYDYVRKSGPEKIPEYMTLHNKLVKDPALKDELKIEADSWAHLKKGSAVPNFTFTDANNKTVSLSDFKGKYVFIDLWATWCGACLAEVPHVEETFELLKGKKIVYLGVSVDKDERKDLWAQMVKEKNMKGVQVHSGPYSDFSKTMKMLLIPRYILIDPKGKMYDCDFPRASSPKQREQLLSLKGL